MIYIRNKKERKTEGRDMVKRLILEDIKQKVTQAGNTHKSAKDSKEHQDPIKSKQTKIYQIACKDERSHEKVHFSS